MYYAYSKIDDMQSEISDKRQLNIANRIIYMTKSAMIIPGVIIKAFVTQQNTTYITSIC